LILYYVYYALIPSITYILTTFVKATFSKSIIFKVKNTFEPNVFKWVIKIIFINSSHFALLIINAKILSKRMVHILTHPQAPYGPNYESKCERIGACSLTCGTLGAEGHTGAPRWD
jgi:hypothetical protein